MPGDPQDVKATPINSTTIKVNWKPPLAKDRNGIIRGYHIHVQETKEEVSKKDIFLSDLFRSSNIQLKLLVLHRMFARISALSSKECNF